MALLREFSNEEPVDAIRERLRTRLEDADALHSNFLTWIQGYAAGNIDKPKEVDHLRIQATEFGQKILDARSLAKNVAHDEKARAQALAKIRELNEAITSIERITGILPQHKTSATIVAFPVQKK